MSQMHVAPMVVTVRVLRFSSAFRGLKTLSPPPSSGQPVDASIFSSSLVSHKTPRTTMTVLTSPAPTSSSVESASSECGDLSTLMSRVKSLMELIKSQYRSNADRSFGDESLDVKPDPSEEQLKRFADLSALKYLGNLASSVAGTSRPIWRDVWASMSNEQRKSGSSRFYESMLSLASKLDPESRRSLTKDVKQSWERLVADDEGSGQTATKPPHEEYAIMYSLALIKRTAEGIIDRARSALTESFETTDTA